MNSYMLAQTITAAFPFRNQTVDAGIFFSSTRPPTPPLQLANLLILHSLGEADNKDDGLQRENPRLSALHGETAYCYGAF